MRLERKKSVNRIKIHHNKTLFWIIVFLVILLISMMIYVRIAVNQNDIKNQNISECTQDDDCIKQKLNCCPCSMGGEEVCMPTKNSSLINERLAKECGARTVCTAMYACQETSCSCINGKCVEQ